MVAAEGDRIDGKEKKVARVSKRSMVLCTTEPFKYAQKADELSQPFDLEFAQLRLEAASTQSTYVLVYGEKK